MCLWAYTRKHSRVSFFFTKQKIIKNKKGGGGIPKKNIHARTVCNTGPISCPMLEKESTDLKVLAMCEKFKK